MKTGAEIGTHFHKFHSDPLSTGSLFGNEIKFGTDFHVVSFREVHFR